jgi:DNA-binding Lrp family transcriptional regulator
MTDLDPVDLKILDLPQKDASLTDKEIALKLHKSVATIHDRTRRLKREGYIQRIVAILDRKKMARGSSLSPMCCSTITPQTR